MLNEMIMLMSLFFWLALIEAHSLMCVRTKLCFMPPMMPLLDIAAGPGSSQVSGAAD